MVVEFQKLHSNYLQSREFALESERRINKLYPSEKSKAVSANVNDMCAVNNRSMNKTILTNKSDGLLSFKGKPFKPLKKESVDKIYNIMKKIIGHEDIKNVSEKEVKMLKAYAERLCKEHPVLERIFGNKTFQKAMTLMNQNQLLADAGIALIYTCCLRPLSIAALPTKDKNEKEKNIYQIGHSISTGLIGFATAFVLQTPIKHSIDKVTTAVTNNNAKKYISKDAEVLFRKENIEKIRMVMERSHQPITLPLKAALTIFLVPRVLKLFGLSKKPKTKPQQDIQEKPQEVKTQAAYDPFQYFAAFKRNKTSFQDFKGGVENENK